MNFDLLLENLTNPGLFLPMALAVTFPVNMTVGMPVYFFIVQNS